MILILDFILGFFVLLFWVSMLYYPLFKAVFDEIISLVLLIVLSPVFVVLTISGAIIMKGNPFFTQDRIGKINKNGKERIFKLIKFRSMTNDTDEKGNLLSFEKRMTKYGKILRFTSLDELPELINIFKGDMSFVGPRPLLAEYLVLFNEKDRMRHIVKPGLTGLAQVSGRNSLTWEERFKKDLEYVNNVSLVKDIGLIFLTFKKVVKRDGIEFTNGHEPIMNYFKRMQDGV